MGLDRHVTNWILSCIQSTSFTILINESPSALFKISIGLRQGCPLSPFLFLIFVEGLSSLLARAKVNNELEGVWVSRTKVPSHLQFMVDVFLLRDGLEGDMNARKKVLDIFGKATGMEINDVKSCLLFNQISHYGLGILKCILPFQSMHIQEGFK